MHKTFSVFLRPDTLKSVERDDEWVFEGIASTADVDLMGEVIYPESFNDSVEFFKTKGKIYFNHEYAQKAPEWLKEHGFSKEEILSLKMPIGKPLDAEVREDGLYIKAELNKKHPLSSFIWNSFMNNPGFENEMGLSVGAKYLGTPRREYDVLKGKYVTYLPNMLLYEVSVTPSPVNPNTKTWAYAMKSMLSTEIEDSKTSYHTIVPDEVFFDETNNKLVIKSTVIGASGKTHVFESYIDVEEDIHTMPKTTRKALPDEFDEEQVADDTENLMEDLGELETDDTEEEADVDAAAMEDDLEEVEDEGGDLATDVLGTDDDAAVDSLMESLVGDDSGEGEDDTQSLILDKLDSILDALQTLADTGNDEMSDELPAAGQVSTTPPALKGVVELSDESTEKFGAALKSILDEWEDRVVDKLIHKLTNETTVVKSVMNGKARVLHPGVAIDDAKVGDNTVVQKSINQKSVINSDELSEEKMDTLKSLVEEYVSIVGYAQSKVQHRGRVIRKAEETLGISQPKFHNYVRRYETTNTLS